MDRNESHPFLRSNTTVICTRSFIINNNRHDCGLKLANEMVDAKVNDRPNIDFFYNRFFRIFALASTPASG